MIMLCLISQRPLHSINDMVCIMLYVSYSIYHIVWNVPDYVVNKRGIDIIGVELRDELLCYCLH